MKYQSDADGQATRYEVFSNRAIEPATAMRTGRLGAPDGSEWLTVLLENAGGSCPGPLSHNIA